MSDSERSYSGTVVAAILLTAMIAGVGYRYWPSNERSIRRHLSNLAEALSFPLAEGTEERLTRIAVLREYFDPNVRIQLDDRELTSRDEILEVLSRFQPPPGGVNVEFVNISITVAADEQSAAVTLRARLSSTNEKGESILDERVADVTMRKFDDDWVIASAVLRAAAANVGAGFSRTFRVCLKADTTARSVRRFPLPSPPASQSPRLCLPPRCRSASRPA